MFSLPELPYSYNSLEPYLDEVTMELHHTKHHQAYVNGINEVFPEKTNLDLVEILKTTRDQKAINMGGGHLNHMLYWESMAPASGQKPEGKLLDSLNSTFGSLEKFQEQFTSKALAVFGSGWAFLVKTPNGKLTIRRHSFQNTPVMQGNVPILALDVWEHAYYLKYQNRRAEYVSAWWNVVNWHHADQLFNL